MKPYIVLAAVALALGSCSARSGESPAEGAAEAADKQIAVPLFDADSAYSYVQTQVAMGPRVPSSAANRRCREWLVDRLDAFGADTVWVQNGAMPDMRGNTVRLANVFGRFNAGAKKRILLLAHYDTRPWADNDADAANHAKAIDGANDGASGVGVILELARNFKDALPENVGVDVLFTDAEDSGISAESTDPAQAAAADLSWCLGAQYFAANLPYSPTGLPRAAILLDMVGARDAVFRHEYFGMSSAPQLARLVWQAAAKAGHGGRFADETGGAVNDDHLPLIQAGIPAIDIIEIGHPETQSFHPSWHTMNDNMDIIDSSTLKAVGETVANFIYNFK